MKEGLLQRITVEQGKCGGRPCIRGKRIRVTDILGLLSAGATAEEILDDYPFLEREDILAAIEYAARQTDIERSLPQVVAALEAGDRLVELR